MRRYESYRNTELPWVGQIPSDWQIKRLRCISDYVSRGNTPSYVDESNIKIVNQACIQFEGIDQAKLKFNEEVDVEGLKGRLELGDVLINSTGTGTLGRVGYFDEDEGDFVADGHVTIVRDSKNRFFPQYLFLYLSTLQDLITAHASDGATNQIELSRNKFRNLLIPSPSYGEQKTIVSFLDKKLEQIDTFIQNKRRLIELLKEQKTAVINKAVTQGLDSSVEMKELDTQWIHKTPAHWQVLQIKRVIKASDYGTSQSTKDEGSFGVLNMGHVQDGEISISNPGYVDDIPKSLLLKAGDLLFNRTNSPELVGKVGLYSQDVEGITFASYLVRLRTNHLAKPKYLNYVLNSKDFVSFARSQAYLSLHQANLNPTRYGMLSIVLPPLDEQNQIVDYLSSECTGIDKAIQNAKQEITLINEYRTTLISEVVTGKIDVRDSV